MASSAPPSDSKAKPDVSKQQPTSSLLNTDDLKTGINFLVTRGDTSGRAATAKDFEILFEAKAKAASLIPENEALKTVQNSSTAQSASDALTKAMDMDGDGKITAKDFELLFQRNMAFLDRNRSYIDQGLPIAGQLLFGFGCGYAVGYMARFLYTKKFMILIGGFAGYSGVQYLLQEQFINQQRVEQTLKKAMMDTADQNSDGQLSREDLNMWIEKRMAIVNAKLGPGGFAPGVAGFASFALGALKAAFRRV